MGAGARIDGRTASAAVLERVAAGARALAAETGTVPGLAVVIVGEDPASQVYVASKARRAEECGFRSFRHALPAQTSEADLLSLVERLNADPAVHGILVQLPLPGHLREAAVIRAIDPDKDVDGFHPMNVGRLAAGQSGEGFVPCTPAGAMTMIRGVLGEDLSGLEAVVVGRSNIVGKPMAQLLLAANATVTIAHSRTRNLPEVCRRADVLVAAVGRPELIRGAWIRPGAVVIDVGINRLAPDGGGAAKGRLVGDVAYDEAIETARAVTPVPGGVGLMTVALLMANTLRAAARAAGAEAPALQETV